MTGPNSLPDLPDEVPVADAVEQTRSAIDPEESVDDVDDYASAPLESNESDWQEQHQAIDDFGEDEFR